jgi:excisionase family DNA binding protein
MADGVAVGRDMFASRSGAGYAALIEARLGRDTGRAYSVQDVAALFNVGETKVYQWIEEGRLLSANLNAGMTVPVDSDRPQIGVRPLRPLWRVTRQAIIEMAKAMEGEL